MIGPAGSSRRLLSCKEDEKMKIVILERNSVGTDVSVDCIKDFGEVTIYRNTVTIEEVKE